MKKCGKVKNPCKICFDTVSTKNGLRCQGACKKWVHFTCLNYTPGKIQDIKAGLIKISCPCPDCDSGMKEEVLHDTGYICDKPKCPARLPPTSCDVPLCPKKFPVPREMEIQCPEDCSPYPDAFPAPRTSETAMKGTQFSQPSKKSQTDVQKPGSSQMKCSSSNCAAGKDTPPRSPMGTPRGTPKGTPKRSPSPRGNPSPKRCFSPPGTPPRSPPSVPCVPPMCPLQTGLAPKSCLPSCPASKRLPPRPQYPHTRPPGPPTRPPFPTTKSPGPPGRSPQRSRSPPRGFHKKNSDECSLSVCKHSVANVPEKKLSVSRSYSSPYASADSMPRYKVHVGSKSECNINSPEATRKLILGAMEQMYSTVGSFSNQFRDLMCRMMEALEKC